MGRRGFSRGVRRSVPVIVLVAVLGLLAGGLPALVASPGGGGHVSGPAAQAPGSQGSVHHLPWYDPRGWFGGGSSVPSSHAVAGTDAAIAYPPHHVVQAKTAPERRVRELVSERTADSRTYLLSDGKRQTVISAGPVNYKTPSGRWAPISTKAVRSPKAGFAFQNTSNTFRSFFGSSPGHLVRFVLPGQGQVEIGLAGAQAVTPKASGSTVTYAGVAPGVSLSYTVTPQSLTEKITLASPAAAKELPALRFTVKTGGGLVPRARRDGSVALTRGGAPVLTLPTPFMTGARARASSPSGRPRSPEVTQKTAWDAKHRTLTLSLAPDMAWAGAAARKYPLTVDPTIVVAPTPTDAQNVMIEQDTPTTNYGGYQRLSVGTTWGGAVRSLLSFPLGAVPTDAQLSSADLELYYDQTFGSGGNETIEANAASAAWNASTVTWNTGPGEGVQGLDEVDVDDSDAAATSASGSWPSQPAPAAVNGSTGTTRTRWRGTPSPGCRTCPRPGTGSWPRITWPTRRRRRTPRSRWTTAAGPRRTR